MVARALVFAGVCADEGVGEAVGVLILEEMLTAGCWTLTVSVCLLVDALFAGDNAPVKGAGETGVVLVAELCTFGASVEVTTGLLSFETSSTT